MKLHERTGMQPISLEVKRSRWTRLQSAADIHSKSGHGLVLWWLESEGETQGDVEEISRAGDEGSRVELGPGDEATDRQHWRSLVSALCVIHTKRIK